MELQREEKREEETEVARMIEMGIKRTGSNTASNQFPKCSPLSGTHKAIQSVG